MTLFKQIRKFLSITGGQEARPTPQVVIPEKSAEQPARPSILQLIEGAYFGQAIGDAMGSQTEFRHGSVRVTDLGPTWGYNFPAFSDDTQNALAILDSLLKEPPNMTDSESIEAFMKELSRTFIAWVRGKYGTNLRAPGNTCLGGVSALQNNGLDWRTSGAIASGKGNGAPMRSSVVGTYLYHNPEVAFQLGALTSIPTHNNVEALLAAGTVSYLVAASIKGTGWNQAVGDLMDLLGNWEDVLLEHTNCPDQFPDWAISRLAAAYAYGKAKLDDEAFFRFNNGHCYNEKVARQSDFKAVEAVAQAIFANTKYRNYSDVILCCANHSGDSDTTAAIAGAIAGARWGSGDIPVRWRNTVELHEKWPDYAQRMYDLVHDSETIPRTTTHA
jgi:ADP-ribosylglycohydrolase